MKRRVLVVVDYYLPGYKGGGPAVSVSRLVDRLQGEIEFFVYTRDRDLGDQMPYPEVPVGQWFERDGIQCHYASPGRLGTAGLLNAIRTVRPDIVYLNSYFSKMSRAALLLKLGGLAKGISFLLAPRGEFSVGALALKKTKKSLYLKAASLIRLHRGLTWQVSSVHEMNDTKAVIEGHAHCFIKAPDLLDAGVRNLDSDRPEKLKGVATFSFISRISPKKNLLGAIEMLRETKGEVKFTIYGPIEDQNYWRECERAIASLPPSVVCEYAGPIPPIQVVPRLSEHHFFLFPTLGENFGHVIPEALNAGCPVLLSDQTPWLDFEEKQAGWVLPLEPVSDWRRVIDECIEMDQQRYSEMSAAARKYIQRLSAESGDLELSRQMFESAMTLQKRDAA